MSAPWEAFAEPTTAPEEKGPWSSFKPPAQSPEEHGPWEAFAPPAAAPIDDPVSHAAQYDDAHPENARAFEAFKQKENRPLNEKLSSAAGEFVKPENYIGAIKGAAKFGAGLLGTGLHSALGMAENVGARVSNAVGQDKLAEDLAQRATTNKAESVLGAQQAEESIKHTVGSIAGPVSRALRKGINADTGLSTERDEQMLREKFDAAVEHARNAQQLAAGKPLDTGAVAAVVRASEGQEPSAEFGPEGLESMGARPASPLVSESIGAAADPNNLLLAKAGTFPGAQTVSGGILKGVGTVGETGARVTANAIKTAAKSRLAHRLKIPGLVFEAATGGAHILPALGTAAAAGGTWAGAKLAQAGFGLAKEAGAEMLGAAPLPGQGFFRSVLKEGLKGGTSTAVGMVPINALESEGSPEEFARGEINAGVFGGALGSAGGAKNARSLAARGYYAQTVKAGEAVNFNDAADDAHRAVMQNLPPQAQAVINFARGQFDGATTPDGKPIRVQAVDDATFRQQTGQSSRGVYFNDGTLLINAGHTARDGTFYPKSAEALNQTLAHEGKHAIDQAHTAAQPELYKTVFDSLKNHFTVDGTNPTPEFAQWIQGQLQLHADNLQQAGATPAEIQTKLAGLGDTQYWLNEASADIGQGLVTGTDLGAFMLPQSLGGKVWDALKDAAAKNGINLPQNTAQGALGVPQAATAARAIRRQLYAAGAESRARIETPGPKATETTPAPAPQAPPSPATPGNSPVTPTAPASPLNRFRIAAILRRNGINAAEATHWANQAEGASDEAAVINALKKRAEAKYGTPPTISPTPEANPTDATAQKAPAVGATSNPLSAENQRPPSPSPVTAEAGEPVPGGIITAEHEIPVTPPQDQPLPNSPAVGAPIEPSLNAAPPGVPEAPANLPDAPAIATALSNAETNTIQSPAYARKRAGKTVTKEQAQAGMVKAARIQALYGLLPETGPGLHRVTDPDTLELSYEGTIDAQNPLHQAILRESGLTPAHVAVLESAQGRIGTGVYLRDYNSAAQELGPAGETEQSAEQRNTEYKQSATSPEKGRRQGGVSKQDKAVTILGVKGTANGVNLVTLDHDKFFDNTRKILDAARPLNPAHPIYTADPKQAGKLIAQAFQDIAENNANGWKSRGDAPQKSFPDNPVKATPGYKGKIVDRFLANVINMALHNRTAKPPTEQRGETELAARKFAKRNATAKEIAGLADINNRPLLESGESNFLRGTLERQGFETDKQIKPVISNIRPDLIEGGFADAPMHGRIVHEHGFDVPAGELTIKGRPAEKAVAGNFLPENLTKNQVGTSNLDASIQKNIDDAKMLNPSDPASFLRKMAAAARTQGKTEAADNFEAAAKQVTQEGAQARFMPDTGKPGESEDKRENLTREAEAAGVVLSVDTLKGLMAEDPETQRKVRARIQQETGKPARFMPDTPEFKQWFGGSKVVDKEGRARVVFHGTRSVPFSEFDASKMQGNESAQQGEGFYFETSKGAAEAYGEAMPVFLKLENPAPKDLVRQWSDYVKSTEGVEKSREAWKSRVKARAKEMRQALEQKGFDGYFPIGSDAGGQWHGEIVVFKPAQIKSATENAGDYDPENPDMRFMPDRNLTKNQVARPDYRTAARARMQKRERELVH